MQINQLRTKSHVELEDKFYPIVPHDNTHVSTVISHTYMMPPWHLTKSFVCLLLQAIVHQYVLNILCVHEEVGISLVRFLKLVTHCHESSNFTRNEP